MSAILDTRLNAAPESGRRNSPLRRLLADWLPPALAVVVVVAAVVIRHLVMTNTDVSYLFTAGDSRAHGGRGRPDVILVDKMPDWESWALADLEIAAALKSYPEVDQVYDAGIRRRVEIPQ
jgi:hypothetical protein